MTNEEKATEISLLQYDMICGYDYPKYASAMEMAQWKDEQHKQEKQQWIEKTVIFLNERVCTEMSIPEIHNMIVDFRKSMEE